MRGYVQDKVQVSSAAAAAAVAADCGGCGCCMRCEYEGAKPADKSTSLSRHQVSSQIQCEREGALVLALGCK
jgi:hypothetical protein